ncbi:transporter [Candidatus Thiothrix sp. Deng01]|uniref:Transporter n=1 Tax=Candidatus Thiothrix phosphatis TaxID=3112415 RepID=A0ABU6CVQ4_9GAMM|nr:transporter [Candidatus Thiothrix sp. Deng01]MEB4590910.1 transporter [Candidatus Thiothrix sp. Deng01]
MRKLWIAAAIAALPLGAHAEGHYVPGIEGVKGASVPPAGNYYIGYFVNYNVDSLKAPGSDNNIPGSNEGTVTALAHRLVHMTDKKVLGADYGMEAIVPMVKKDFDFQAAGYNKSKSGIADVYLGPVVLGWHGDRWDAVGAAGFWLDSANSDELASPGNGYKGTMLTGGGTAYLNPDKSVSASALLRYELNGKKDGGFEPGDQLTMEWGLGKKLNAATEVGLVGYDQWQTTKDKGVGATDDKFSKHAVGLEGSYTVKSLGGIVKAAYYNEYDVKAGSGPAPSGNTFRLNFVKPF